MTAKPPSSKHGFRAIPLEDFDWEAARHFARTNGTSVEEALFEYTREQYVNQLLTEWQSASQIFCRFIERMAPHASPVEIVLALRETAKTYDDLVTAGLLMRDGVKLLFLCQPHSQPAGTAGRGGKGRPHEKRGGAALRAF